ncbi:MAG: RDD family protein [Desulfobacterales bacterium]|nr:RDD family protein [Desulfobacterales bacterium]
MHWYYAINREKQGPLTDTDFYELVQSGTIKDETLVWNESMTEWTPFGQIGSKPGEAEEPVPPNPAPDAGATMAAPESAGSESSGADSEAKSGVNRKFCSQCGNSFPEDELAGFQGNLVCASCKPAFLQKIREGVSTGEMLYAGFWIRLGAKLIDGIILGILNFVISLAFGALIFPMAANPEDIQAVMIPSLIMGFFQWAVNIGYATWFVGRFAATPGKMVCGLKVVTAEGDKVTYLRAFGRCFGELVSSLILGIGYLMAAFDSEKRTLHDRICSTRVIKK